MRTIKIYQAEQHFTALSHFNCPSENRKIGDVAQTWHLTNERPSQAYLNGNDTIVCGDCPLRSKHSGGNGVCYVTTIHGPNAVHSSHRTKDASQHTVNQSVQTLPGRISKPVRFGAYGDPTTMPIRLARKLSGRATGHIGYTHQWHKCSPAWAEFTMASIDPAMAKVQGCTVAELKEKARRKGYRTFRVLADGELPMADEIVCPNETRGTQCAGCGLCGGSSRKAKNIVIHAHGTGKGALKQIAA